MVVLTSYGVSRTYFQAPAEYIEHTQIDWFEEMVI